MIDARTARRLRLAMLMALLIVLALGSFWLYEVMRRAATDSTPQRIRTEPDFYVENFSYVKMSAGGKVQYHFSGARMTHDPQADSYAIAQPVLSNLASTAAPMTIRAERATVNHDNTQVHLYDNVRVDRPASPANDAMHLRSDYLLLLPEDEIMQTDRPVEIIVGQTKLRGTGLLANNATRELKLTSNVHGTYQAAAR